MTKSIAAMLALFGTFSVPTQAETEALAPVPEEVILQPWIGICQTGPYAVYKLNFDKDGTGTLKIRHRSSVLINWKITQWKIDGEKISFAFAKNERHADLLTGTGVLDAFTPRLILTTHWKGRDDLGKRSIVLFSEKQIQDALEHIESGEKKPPDSPRER